MQRNLDSVIRVSVLLIEMTLHQRHQRHFERHLGRHRERHERHETE